MTASEVHSSALPARHVALDAQARCTTSATLLQASSAQPAVVGSMPYCRTSSLPAATPSHLECARGGVHALALAPALAPDLRVPHGAGQLQRGADGRLLAGLHQPGGRQGGGGGGGGGRQGEGGPGGREGGRMSMLSVKGIAVTRCTCILRCEVEGCGLTFIRCCWCRPGHLRSPQ